MFMFNVFMFNVFMFIFMFNVFIFMFNLFMFIFIFVFNIFMFIFIFNIINTVCERRLACRTPFMNSVRRVNVESSRILILLFSYIFVIAVFIDLLV